MNLPDYIKESNQSLQLFEKFPWIGDNNTECVDIFTHMEDVGKKTGRPVIRTVLNDIVFEADIMEKYKDKFLRTMSMVVPNTNTVHLAAYFQITNDLFISFGFSTMPGDDKTIVLTAQFYAVSYNTTINFVTENVEFLVNTKPEKVGLGFK